jgi:RNA-binding protein NOB1
LPAKQKPTDEEAASLEKAAEQLILKDENEPLTAEKAEEQADGEENDVEEDEDEEDEEGWIKPSNLEDIKRSSKIDAEQESLGEAKLKVACMTSDFAMQVFICFIKDLTSVYLDLEIEKTKISKNVLIQIGIPVLSVDGLLIKKARNYVLKCITCKK